LEGAEEANQTYICKPPVKSVELGCGLNPDSHINIDIAQLIPAPDENYLTLNLPGSIPEALDKISSPDHIGLFSRQSICIYQVSFRPIR
jgi:hypothetical protein